MRQTSAVLWNSINLLRKKNLKAGSSFCGELSWALSSKGGGSCHLLQAGKQAYWKNIKVIKDQMLGNRGAKFFCGFSRVLAVLELIISSGLHSTDCPALCAQTPAQDACLDENMGVVLFNMPRQEGARVCCGFNIQGTRLCRTLQAAPSPAVGCSLRLALQSWMWHSHCTRVSQGLPGTTEKSWFIFSCFLYKYLGI